MDGWNGEAEGKMVEESDVLGVATVAGDMILSFGTLPNPRYPFEKKCVYVGKVIFRRIFTQSFGKFLPL